MHYQSQDLCKFLLAPLQAALDDVQKHLQMQLDVERINQTNDVEEQAPIINFSGPEKLEGLDISVMPLASEPIKGIAGSAFLTNAVQSVVAGEIAKQTSVAAEIEQQSAAIALIQQHSYKSRSTLNSEINASQLTNPTPVTTEKQPQFKSDILTTTVLSLTPTAVGKLMQTTVHTTATATEQQFKPDMIAAQVIFANHPAKPSISPALPLTSVSDRKSTPTISKSTLAAQTAIGTNNLNSPTMPIASPDIARQQPAKANLLIQLRKNTTPENQSQTLSATQNLPTAIINRFESVLEPALQQAYQVTQQQLQNTGSKSREPEFSGRVRNTFNVSVTMNNSGTAENIDLAIFEKALTDVLLTAARRQGLEV